MKLTKYQHACFTVELDRQLLVVDPGTFTTEFPIPDHIAAVVITHEHRDHFDPDILATIAAENPDALFVAHESITARLPDVPIRSVAAGNMIAVGPFNLEFFGGLHAPIHPGLPDIPNLGVMVNDALYYPGDSFALPGKPIDILALPVTAPWLKASEVIEFLQAAKPQQAFPTHDAIASRQGKEVIDRLLLAAAEDHGIEYRRLDDTIDF